jgi:regulator of PEP synthase PpsR (kinase-PPPase family)
VLYTMLETALPTRLQNKCREFSVPCLSILDPVLGLFQSYLGAESTKRAGAQHTLNADISSASMRSTTPCCTTTASTPTISSTPTSY